MKIKNAIVWCYGLLVLLPLSAGALELKTDEQRLSYALGQMSVMSMKLEGSKLDTDIVVQSVRDALEGKPSLLSKQEVFAAINKSRAGNNPASSAGAQQNQLDGENFLRSNKSKEGIVELPSGLQYRIIKKGQGQQPGPQDIVVADYVGTLVDGTKFDSSYDRGQPATFGVNRVIPGWTEALQLMQVGDKWQLFIPSELAYGPKAVGKVIKPNSTLVFEVELLSVKSP